MNVPSAIRLRRLRLGLTIDEVARACNCTNPEISLLERDIRSAARLRAKLEEFYSAQEKLARRTLAR